MKKSKLLLAAVLTAAASVAVGGEAQTIESTQTVQTTQPIQVAQAQTRKGKKSGKKAAGACSHLRVGQKVTERVDADPGNHPGGEIVVRIEKIFPATGEIAVRCVTINGNPCNHVPATRASCSSF